MNGNNDNFLYLNRDNRWLDFNWEGLELGEDGALRLYSLPLLERELPEGVDKLLPLDGPAGIAVAPDGTIYYTDPAGHGLLKINSCDGTLAAVPCVEGEGEEPTRFRKPRGVLFHLLRKAIFIVDSGNHRIQIFEPHSFQLIGIWGEFGTEPGRFNTPWTLASDSEGNVYVVDYGNNRVQKFDFLGNVIPSFWENAKKESGISKPSDIAAGIVENSNRIFILDASLKTVFIFDSTGTLLGSFGSELLDDPMGLLVSGGAVYVGDNDQSRLHKFTVDGKYVGRAVGYEGPVAAIGLDNDGSLLIHTGSGLAPVRLAVKGGYLKKGILWGGPFKNPSFRSEQYHLLKTKIDSMPGAHFRLFVYPFAPPPDTKNTNPSSVSPPPAPNLEATESFSVPPWQPIDLDVREHLFPGKPSDHVWVGVEFMGEGLSSPLLSQMRLGFDHESYIQYLPEIYKQEQHSRSFLTRFLSLFESLFSDAEDSIANLSVLFDPDAVPAVFLSWLAGWLAIELDENWSEEKKRQVFARAFEMYAQRGTAKGIINALHFYAGVDARIEEPILHAAWWSLPEYETSPSLETGNSILGFTTMLAPAEAQGAVLSTTAVLDGSHLITQQEFGVPLFQDVAHQFLVQVYRGQVSGEKKLDEIRKVIEREKPAHTAYHLCIVEPRMRIGFQSVLGVDTIIAGPLSPTRLGEEFTSGTNLILGGEPMGSIAERSEIGRTTRLGEGVLEI